MCAGVWATCDAILAHTVFSGFYLQPPESLALGAAIAKPGRCQAPAITALAASRSTILAYPVPRLA